MIWLIASLALLSLIPSAWLGLREHNAARFAVERGILGQSEINFFYRCWFSYWNKNQWNSPHFMYSGLRSVARNVVKSTSLMGVGALYQGYIFYVLYRLTKNSSSWESFYTISYFDILSVLVGFGTLLTIIGSGFSFTAGLVRDINNVVARYEGADISSFDTVVSPSFGRNTTEVSNKIVSQVKDDARSASSSAEEKAEALKFLHEIGAIDERGKPNYEARNTRATRHLPIEELKKGPK